jgi:uncharacterized protein YkwD
VTPGGASRCANSPSEGIPSRLRAPEHRGHTAALVKRFDCRPLLLLLGALVPACLDGSGLDEGDADADVGADDDGEDTAPDDAEVPDIAFCDDVADWDPSWSTLEEQVLAIVNQHRAAGADCRTGGMFGPTHALTMDPALRCSARKHSADMAARNFFDHTNPSGEDPFVRMQQAGYSFQAAGENIAAGSPDAAGTMQQWMDSDGHCTNIMSPNFTEIGVGYSTGGMYGTLWTQNFGAPL